MPHFFCDISGLIDHEVEIHGSDAKHISQVLRLGPGDTLVITDKAGHRFDARIISSEPRSVRMILVAERATRKPSRQVVLAQALIKHDGMEWVIQKAVELGVQRVIPFISQRCVPQYHERAGEKRVQRWQAIALAAAKQSGLPEKPIVEPIISFARLCEILGDFAPALFCWEAEKSYRISQALEQHACIDKPTLCIIGPEGGFALQEVAIAKQHGANSVSLGPQILRVETAALASIAVIQHLLGNLAPD